MSTIETLFYGNARNWLNINNINNKVYATLSLNFIFYQIYVFIISVYCYTTVNVCFCKTCFNIDKKGLVFTKSSYILKQTCRFQLQVYLSMCDLQRTSGIKGFRCGAIFIRLCSISFSRNLPLHLHKKIKFGYLLFFLLFIYLFIHLE